MNHHTTRRGLRRPAVRGTSLLAAVLLALLVPIGAASAHDNLISTNPDAGSTVEKMPKDIAMTYDNIPIAMGSEIHVVDADGTNWATGEATVTNRVVKQAVQPGTPAGTYTVQWRVVSSDGHPIQGEFSFTTRTGAKPGAATPPADPGVSSAAEPAGQGIPPWIIPSGVAVLILIGAGIAIFWRRIGTD